MYKREERRETAEVYYTCSALSNSKVSSTSSSSSSSKHMTISKSIQIKAGTIRQETEIFIRTANYFPATV